MLHTIHAEAANIKVSYAGVSSVMLGCMESNWMTQNGQQIEKNSFGNLFGYKHNVLSFTSFFIEKNFRFCYSDI